MIKGYLKVFMIMCALTLSTAINAQKNSGPDDLPPDLPTGTDARVFTFVEQNPQFPGGDQELMRILQQNIIYPDFERVLGIEGKVIVRFIVTEDGSVDSVVVRKSVSKGLDDESVMVVKRLPKFTPGRQQGKAVKVYFNLPVVYRLSGNSAFLNEIENLAQQNTELKNGLEAVRKRDFATGIPLLEMVAKKNRNVNIYELLWVCYHETGDSNGMCDALNKAIKHGMASEISSREKYCQ